MAIVVSNCHMKLRFAVVSLLLFAIADAQTPRQAVSAPQWQQIDQLCGQIQRAAPQERELVVNGKREKLLYTTYVPNASLILYAVTNDNDHCCAAKPAATAKAARYGAFHFDGVSHGKYWMRIQTQQESYVVPLLVTRDFDQKSCHDPSVARDIIVDSAPPRVETRIR